MAAHLACRIELNSNSGMLFDEAVRLLCACWRLGHLCFKVALMLWDPAPAPAGDDVRDARLLQSACVVMATDVQNARFGPKGGPPAFDWPLPDLREPGGAVESSLHNPV